MRKRTLKPDIAKRPFTEIPPPNDLDGFRFEADGGEYLVLSYPLSPVQLPDGLTEAQQEVLRGIIAGRTNAEIAGLRGTSTRTVANQIASIFVKLGVSSRAELVAVLSTRGG